MQPGERHTAAQAESAAAAPGGALGTIQWRASSTAIPGSRGVGWADSQGCGGHGGHRTGPSDLMQKTQTAFGI